MSSSKVALSVLSIILIASFGFCRPAWCAEIVKDTVTPNPPYEEALLLLQQGNNKSAKLKLESTLQVDPKNEQAQGLLGYMLLRSGKSDEALLHLRQANELNHSDAAVHFNLGITWVNLKKPKDAFDEFKIATEIKPDFAVAWYDLGELSAAIGDLAQARQAMNTFLKLVPVGRMAGPAKNYLKMFDTAASANAQLGADNDYLSCLHPDEIARWPSGKSHLKVFVQPSDYIPGYKLTYKKELLDAFKCWSDALSGAISFDFVDDFGEADIAVCWTTDPKAPAYKVENGNCHLVLKKGTGEIERAFISLFAMNPGYYVQMSPELMYTICLHEIGHALGIIGHSSKPSDLMYFFSLPDNERHSLSDRDINTMKKLYSKEMSPTAPAKPRT